MTLIILLQSVFLPPKPFNTSTEALFLRDHSKRLATHRRIAVIVALCICLAYLIADLFNAHHDAAFNSVFNAIILPLRLLGIMAMLLTTWLSFRSALVTSERYANACAIFCISTIYLMLLALTYAIPFPADCLYYYDGMLLVLLYCFGLSRILAKPMCLLLSVLLVLTAITFSTEKLATAIAQLDPAIYQEHKTPLGFLIIFSMIGYFIALEQERAARYTFLRELELLQSREEAKHNADALLALTEQSRLQAEQQNQDKSKFIANAAHDLRNAMQPIENYLAVTDSALAHNDIPQAQQYLSAAKGANKTMRNTVSALLDISALESGLIKLHYSHFNVRLLIAEVLQEQSLLAHQYNVTLRLSNNQTLPTITYSDRQHLKRIIINLVSNAIKYADTTKGEAASVVIAIVSHVKSLRIDIIDNGIGIPLSEQDNIFKPLVQLNNPERDRDKGMGLGLSIVTSTLKLLSKHSIRLRSTPSIGTRFSLLLPKGDALAITEALPINSTHPSLSGLYILVVENDLLVKQSLLALLQSNGAEYEGVGLLTELQALLPHLQRIPDLVITDYRLADDYTAVDVIHCLTSIFGYELPILIMTGETVDLSSALQGRQILQKPVAANQLLTAINQLAH